MVSEGNGKEIFPTGEIFPFSLFFLLFPLPGLPKELLLL